MAIILDGKKVARENETILRSRVDAVTQKIGKTPTLATIIVGDFAPSIMYVKMKRKACERIGLGSALIELPNSTSTEQLHNIILELNANPSVCGILLQHPVPAHIDEQKCFNAIAVEKDVDGVNSASFGAMSMGLSAYTSATPRGIIMLLDAYNIPLSGKNAVVVGRSPILGKPMAMALLNKDCTVTICHSKTENLAQIVNGADIVVGAVGKPKFIKGEWIKDGATVIDAGYNEGNIGDIDLEACIGRCSAYTPVPGGVGPMTINALLTQAVESAEKICKSKEPIKKTLEL